MFPETMPLLASEPHQEPKNEKSMLAVLPSGTALYSPQHTPPTLHKSHQHDKTKSMEYNISNCINLYWHKIKAKQLKRGDKLSYSGKLFRVFLKLLNWPITDFSPLHHT
jgi:hypothetical protein